MIHYKCVEERNFILFKQLCEWFHRSEDASPSVVMQLESGGRVIRWLPTITDDHLQIFTIILSGRRLRSGASYYWLPPGCQRNPSLLQQIQQQGLSAASPSHRTAFFLAVPISPTTVISFQTDCVGKPKHSTSAGYDYICQPLSLQSHTRSLYCFDFL